jgi:hypothetical protein
MTQPAKKKSLSKASAKKKSPPKKASEGPFVTEDSHAAFLHFKPLVERVPEDKLDAWNGDAEIVRTNATRGVDAIRPHLDHLREALPLLNINELLELPALCFALGFAADRVFMRASTKEIQAAQKQIRPVRSQALRQLEIFAERGLLPQERVRNIRQNTGPVDEARDAVAIPALFHEFSAAVKNKHPFTAAELKQLAEKGDWLLKQLLPTGATADKGPRNPDAVLRDQLWTEVLRRYDGLYQAGVEIWGRRGVDAHIPPLMSRVATTSERESAEDKPAAQGSAAEESKPGKG